MNKILLITQARFASTRLKGKVLKRVLGRELLWWFLGRCKRSKNITGVVVATTHNKLDNDIYEFSCGNVLSYRGSEEDLLERYKSAALAYGADIIVRVTSDCPFVDWELIDRCVEVQQATGADAVRTQRGGFPLGLDVEVFTRLALDRAYVGAKSPHEREHVGPYIFENPDLFHIEWVKNQGEPWPPCRLTLDYPEDLELVRVLYEAVGPLAPVEEYRKYLLAHPEVAAINAMHVHS